MADFPLGTTFDIMFTTAVNTVPTTLSGGTVAAYADANTTEITAGVTLSADYDSRTGLNKVHVIATSGNGFASGSSYNLVLTAGTVGGVTVAPFFIENFTLERASADVIQWIGTAVTLSGGLPDTNAKTIAAAAIGASQFAANAVDSAALATSAANEIRDAILSDSTPFAGAKVNNLPEGIKKNTSLSNFEFLMRDSADHVTGKTGLTITAQRSIDGAAFGACANSATEVASGVYTINLAAGDLNGDVVTFKFTATGADATILTIKTSP